MAEGDALLLQLKKSDECIMRCSLLSKAWTALTSMPVDTHGHRHTPSHKHGATAHEHLRFYAVTAAIALFSSGAPAYSLGRETAISD